MSYDKHTGRPRGFGFVVFADPIIADKVRGFTLLLSLRRMRACLPEICCRPCRCLCRTLLLLACRCGGAGPLQRRQHRMSLPAWPVFRPSPTRPPTPALATAASALQVISVQHTIDRREVEAKRALPKEESPVSKDQQAVASGQRTKKIFVGGLAATVDEDAFRAYFEDFGQVGAGVVEWGSGSGGAGAGTCAALGDFLGRWGLGESGSGGAGAGARAAHDDFGQHWAGGSSATSAADQ